MLKVLIADDEEKEVSFLLKAVPWADMGLEVVGVAENGKAADELESLLRPDIIISDILMPLVTGTEFVERVRARRDDVHIIFLSGHRNFDYAQAAICSGVDNYLLKPVNPEQLKSVLLQVTTRCIEAKRRRFEGELFQAVLRENMPILRDMMLRQLLSGMKEDVLSERLRFYNIVFRPEELCVAVLLPDAAAPAKNEYELNLEHYRLVSAVNEIISSREYIYFFAAAAPGQYAVIINCPQADKVAAELLYQVQKNVELMCKQNVAIGVGPVVHTLQDIPESYHSALLTVDHCFFVGPGQLLFYNDIIEEPLLADADNRLTDKWLEDIKAQLAKSVVSGRTDKAREALQAFESGMRQYHLSMQMIRNVCMELTNAAILQTNTYYAELLSSVLGGDVSFLPLMEIQHFPAMVQWISSVLLPVCEAIQNKQLSRQNSLVAKMKAYMDDNLAESITAESVAGAVHLSRGYASTIYKKHTGMGINQYLLSIRMSKAQELLRQPALKIRDIVSRVGFFNNAHFSSVFKREVGVTPREYREQVFGEQVQE